METTATHRCPWIVQYLLASPLRKLMEPQEKLIGPYVRPGMTVLEPGCGFGYVSLAAAKMVGPTGRVIAVDVEARAIARLKRRARAKGVRERVDARACTSRDLGLADYENQVDLITVIHALHEFEDLPGFLTQATALLKPTGKMLVVEPRGHVKEAQFCAEIAACCERGYEQVAIPAATGLKSYAALLRPISG